MTDRDSFLAAIRDYPELDGPREIYSDWLEEQGEADRAEFIRVQVELAAMCCHQQGAKPGDYCDDSLCEHCHGKGEKLRSLSLSLFSRHALGRPCERCEGTGWPSRGPSNEPRCPKCLNSFQNAIPEGSPNCRRCATCKIVFEPTKCPDCHGLGHFPGWFSLGAGAEIGEPCNHSYERPACWQCGGSGRIVRDCTVRVPCSRCEGTGEPYGSDRTYNPPNRCPVCHGSGAAYSFLIRRGFADLATCRLDAILRPCEVSRWVATQYHPQECICRGSGYTPGPVAEILRREPVCSVKVEGRQPFTHYSSITGQLRAVYRWWCYENEAEAPEEHRMALIPKPIYELLRNEQPFDSPTAALDSLSRATIQWCRNLEN
jgi:uncharacterized protein (TIGR02996 family)